MTKIITLTKGFTTKVDDKDFEWLSQWKWFYNHGYAVRTVYIDGKCNQVRMHRVINNTPDGMDTDHIDGDKLNNQSQNLRDATRSQNIANQKTLPTNKLGIKGVRFHKRNKNYVSQITVDRKHLHLGSFATAEEAKAVYDLAAVKYFGEFAKIK